MSVRLRLSATDAEDHSSPLSVFEVTIEESRLCPEGAVRVLFDPSTHRFLNGPVDRVVEDDYNEL